MLAADLVDEIRTFTFPVLLGTGKRLFDESSQPRAFTVTHSAVSPNGLIAATYMRDGEVMRAAHRQRLRLSGGTELSFITAGEASKPAVLLLHGTPQSALYFRNVVPELSRAAYVIAPDLPGFGESDLAATAHPRRELGGGLAGDAAAWADRQGASAHRGLCALRRPVRRHRRLSLAPTACPDGLGRHEPFFYLAQILSWTEDLPRMQAHILDGGHMLLETHAAGAASLMVDFIERSQGSD